jgi:hypothetical protein
MSAPLKVNYGTGDQVGPQDVNAITTAINTLATTLAGLSPTVTVSQITDAGAFGATLLRSATLAAALSSLGGGATGESLFAASSSAAALSVLGAGSVGVSILNANTQAAAQSALGVTNGAGIPELPTGTTTPTYTIGSDAGSGATVTVAAGGTPLSHRISVTTGTNPVNGGMLCSRTLSGYTNDPPQAQISPANLNAASCGIYKITTASTISIYATSELQPNTAYLFDVFLSGVLA